jgi:hypothetical protein|tara:strand:+ start:169 stop:288 length:120 start_codon:yes stop_codon:yes gene_type:complete
MCELNPRDPEVMLDEFDLLAELDDNYEDMDTERQADGRN